MVDSQPIGRAPAPLSCGGHKPLKVRLHAMGYNPRSAGALASRVDFLLKGLR
jgi:hypothetical protein